MISRITGGETTFLFSTTVLNKYQVSYYRCNDTGFIQTEDPYWLAEAYTSAIASLDVGIVLRNQNLSAEAETIINRCFRADGKFIDYAGGYGLFTRMMRDKGYDFYHTDPYCQNIFAAHFDLSTLSSQTDFELLTAFEVFEHLTDPVTEIANLFSYSPNVLFSTELVPSQEVHSPSDWWYFVPETGQHIAFYSKEALEYIAEKNKKHFYSNGSTLHIFSENKLKEKPFTKDGRDKFLPRKLKKLLRKVEGRKKRMSLITPDTEFIKQLNLQDAEKKK